MAIITAERLAPVASQERVESIDVVRGIALFGVLQINLVTAFRVSIFREFETRHTDSGWLNHLTDDVLSIAVFSKAFALFSFLFGVGLGVQAERAGRAGRPFLPFAARRLVVLLGIGLVHFFLINNGDILTMYAVVALIAAPFIGRSTRVLVALSAIALFASVAPIPYPEMFGPGESMQAHIDKALIAYGHGTFIDVARFRIHEVRHIFPLLLQSIPRTIGLFFLGVLAWRKQFFETPGPRSRSLRAIAGVGILVGAGAQMAVFAERERWVALPELVSDGLRGFGDITLALGYAAAIVLLARRPSLKRVAYPFACVGRAALTNYLVQSLLFDGLFYGYGGGLFGRLGPAVAAALGTAIFALQIWASVTWFRHFRYGPVEWVWRSATYGARQPLRNKPLSPT